MLVAAAAAAAGEESPADDIHPLKRIAGGNYGTVVLCRDSRISPSSSSSSSSLLVLKMVDKTRLDTPERVERILTELQLLKDVAPSSPFLVHGLGFYQTNNAAMFALDYCECGDLLFYFQKHPTRFGETALNRLLLMQIAEGIHALHQFGVVWRDAKMENVLIGGDGRLKLCDFGLVKFLQRKPVTATATPPAPSSSSPTPPSASDPLHFATNAVVSATSSLSGFARKSLSHTSLSSFFASASSSFHNNHNHHNASASSLPASTAGSEEDAAAEAAPALPPPPPRNGRQRNPEDDDPWLPTRTRYCGTTYYLSPQSVAGKPYGLEHDWWGFGVLCYEMCCGQLPFYDDLVSTGSSPAGTYRKILRNRPRMRHFKLKSTRLFVRQLLTTSRTKRLGYGQHGFASIQSHSFFADEVNSAGGGGGWAAALEQSPLRGLKPPSPSSFASASTACPPTTTATTPDAVDTSDFFDPSQCECDTFAGPGRPDLVLDGFTVLRESDFQRLLSAVTKT